MPIHFNLRPDQLEDLAIIRDLGSEKIQWIINSLSRVDPHPIRLSELGKLLEPGFEGKEESLGAVIRTLLSLYTLRRQRDISANDLVKGLKSGIARAEEPWSSELLSKWNSLERQLVALFSLESVWTLAKSMDLSYDHENLLQNFKIITDVRPVFNDDASAINGSLVSFTLRIYYDTLEASKSLSLSLDKKDILKLNAACERAISKANTAVRVLSKTDMKNVLVCGEEEE